MFQSTRPRGARRRASTIRSTTITCFNPRARVGRDALLPPNPRWAFMVSIHAPAWGATGDGRPFFNPLTGFNPRARVGRDYLDKKTGTTRHVVSIHAPAWGATVNPSSRPFIVTVSIHAPAWGATHRRHRRHLGYVGFNPRARVGRDLRLHAAGENGCFNPRARVGRDLLRAGPDPPLRGFNPRARVGRDWATGAPCPPAKRFNPRARVGRDVISISNCFPRTFHPCFANLHLPFAFQHIH